MGRGPAGTGVEPLKDTIRLRFTYKGKRRYETMNLPPTPANIKAMERHMQQVKEAIRFGTFDYRRYFPGSGAAPASSGDTFAKFADAWLETVVAEASTLRAYKYAVKRWNDALGEMALKDIVNSDVKKAVSDYAKLVSGKTVNNGLISLRAIFDAAVADEIISKSPMGLVKNLKHQAPKPDPFTVEERDAILAHLQGRYPAQVWNYYDLSFRTGLRPSEQVVLRWGKIDWNLAEARIDTAKVNGKEKGTKTSQVRDVDLTDAAVAVLRRQKAFTFLRGSDHVVFENPRTEEAWNDDRSQRQAYFTPTLKALGIRLRDAYQCRHTYATLALMGGVNPAYVARQMGHANTGMLFKHYAKWIDRADHGRERDKMNALTTTPSGHELATQKRG